MSSEVEVTLDVHEVLDASAGQPPPPPTDHTVEYTVTEDGWTIGLRHYSPPGERPNAVPVIFCHGLACNDYAFRASEQESLTFFMKSCGYHVWLMNLRGAGISAAPPAGTKLQYTWGLREYIEQDAKAAIEYVCACHRCEQVHFVGHSMGGLVGLSLLTLATTAPRLRSVTTIATALMYQDSMWRWMDSLTPFSGAVKVLDMPSLTRFYALCALVSAPDFISVGKNMDPALLRDLLHNGFAKIPTKVLTNLRTCLSPEGFSFESSEGSTKVVCELLADVTAPVLMIAADKDAECSIEGTFHSFEKLKKARKLFVRVGKAAGCSNHYGHFDVLLGKDAGIDVFPHIVEWVQRADDDTSKTR